MGRAWTQAGTSFAPAPLEAMEGEVLSERFGDLGADGTSRRLAIMGGTFDPIHFGHLFCAEQAATALGFDGVIFVPAADPAFKQGQPLTDIATRMALVSSAVADNATFDVSAVEARRPGITYTIDTLRQFRAHYPDNVSLFFIIGSDSLETLHQWKDAEELAKLAEFACVMRPGSSVSADRMEELTSRGFRIHRVDAPLLDISSSGIRRALREGRSIRYLLPEQVRKKIAALGLYANDPREAL